MKIDLKISEKKFQEKVVAYLKQRGAYVIKHTATGYGRSGIPDLLVCFHGVFMGVEMKREGGKLTHHQARELNDIVQSGGWGLDLYPSRMPDFIGLLDTIEKQRNAQRQAAANIEQMMKEEGSNDVPQEIGLGTEAGGTTEGGKAE